MRQRAKIQIVGVEAFGTLSPRPFDLRPPQARLDDAGHLVGYLILQVENVLQRTVIFVGPEMRSGFSFEQLCRDAHASPGLAHASLQHVTHAKLTPDLARVDRLAFVDEARAARGHEEPLDPRQRRDDVLDHSVGEIFLLRIAAHVLKRQHCN